MPRIRNERNDSIDQLFHGILALQDLEECYRFFGDLFTVQAPGGPYALRGKDL